MIQDRISEVTISSGGKSVTMKSKPHAEPTPPILETIMWVRKIKVKDKRVRIEYNVGTFLEAFEDMVFTTMNPKDFAVLEFYTAFDKLAEFVPEICEMEKSYGDGMATISLSISYPGEDKVMGACITVSKQLLHNQSPMIITTPFKASDMYFEDGNEDILLPSDCSLAIRLMIDRATDFIKGLRAPEEQEELFEEAQ